MATQETSKSRIQRQKQGHFLNSVQNSQSITTTTTTATAQRITGPFSATHTPHGTTTLHRNPRRLSTLIRSSHLVSARLTTVSARSGTSASAPWHTDERSQKLGRQPYASRRVDYDE
ncbi:hypothetical protein SVAN01_06527 [Stagonosporopsis vannaccii]|nr:hypothetical protein SVAN01_06527 [Stagonosporopsis vannaccii]